MVAWLLFLTLTCLILLGSLMIPSSLTNLTHLFTPFRLRFSFCFNYGLLGDKRGVLYFCFGTLFGLATSAGGLGSFTPSITAFEGKEESGGS